VVALLSPLALSPFSLLVFCDLRELCTTLSCGRIIQGTLKTAGFALSCTPPSKDSNSNSSSGANANVNTNMGAFSKIIPLLS
jgi:hypothetical protein